jgi:bla regulator protein BlaR1
MHLTFIKELFTNQATSAICWTLLHSLWQGLLFTIVAGFVMMITKKSSSAIRYNILSILFFLFLIVSAFTFILEWNNSISANRNQAIVNSPPISWQTTIQSILLIHPDRKQPFLEIVTNFLSLHASLIVTIWFIILSAKIVKLISALVYTQHIRNHKTHKPSFYWRNKIALLCDQLKIGKPIVLLESEIIKMPSVFGHLKPVIFIPLGLLTHLQPEEVESILLHELAHIRRSDYLINLLQNLAEIIYFFNPALLWMSSLIRDERENCCDDIAIGHTKNRKQFVQALISFRELPIHNSRYITAFPGNRNRLVQRVTRIVQNKNKTLNPVENIYLILSLLIISFITFAFAQNKELNLAEASSKMIIKDTLPVVATNDHPEMNEIWTSGDYFLSVNIDKSNLSETIIAKKGGDNYKIMQVQDAITEFYINDKKIPLDKIPEYRRTINEIFGELHKMEAEQVINVKEQKQREAEQAVREEEQKQREAEQAVREKEQKQREADQAVREKEQKQKEVELKNLIDDLISDNIIKGSKKLKSFSLNSHEFIVNG